jgi:trans-aconitate methyltransferase
VLAEVADFTGARVLDVGCGLGDYADYLRDRFAKVDYVGIDLSRGMIAHARERRRNLDVRVGNVLDAEFDDTFDVVNANGVFYLLGEEAPLLMPLLIERMWSLARVAVAFTSLSSWAPERLENEFQADPLEILTFCRTLTPRIVFRHDYLPHDFAVFLYREPQT